jgi:DNA-binding transcriptional LysR family regulator
MMTILLPQPMIVIPLITNRRSIARHPAQAGDTHLWPSMIRHIDLHALVQTLIAAEQGSFHKAGLRLGVQPSTVSRRVKTLERRVGVALFERHNHGVRPTQSGRDFLDSARRILGDLEGLVTNARNAGRGESGWLRVGLYVSLSRGPLRDALFAYMDRFPKVEVRIIDESRHSLIERLNNGAVDVVVFAGQAWNGTHDVLPLWSERVLLALAEDHRLRNQSAISWDDLRRERFLFGSRDPGQSSRISLSQSLTEREFFQPLYRPTPIATPSSGSSHFGVR